MPKKQVKAGGGKMDLVFVVDETGSMGEWQQSVKKHIRSIIQTITSMEDCSGLRIGLIGYRDHTSEWRGVATNTKDWAVKVRVALTDDIDRAIRGVNEMAAMGGGDYPEALCDGLYELARLPWRNDATKTAVLIADAPPHGVGASGDSFPRGCPCGEDWLEQVAACREVGVQIHTVWCAPPNEGVQWVFERIASETFGQCFALENTDALPTLITGVASCDLDKQRVAAEVLAEVTSHPDELREIAEEGKRIDSIFVTLSRRGLVTRSKTNAQAKVKDRPIARADVVQAIESLCDSEVVVGELFPTRGGAQKKEAGLMDSTTHTPVPLKSVTADVKIVGGVAAEVRLSQVFVNEGLTPIEARYLFPVDDLAAVCGFEAEIDGKTIVADVEEKEKAARVYDDALAAGKGAVLLESNGDMFEMSIGNLQPGKSAVVRVTYVTALEPFGDSVRFVLQTTAAPVYHEPAPLGSQKQRLESGSDFDTAHGENDVKIGITVNVQMPCRIESVTSPTHSVSVDVDGSQATAQLKEGLSEMTSDFVLLIKADTKTKERSIVTAEEWDGANAEETPVAMAASFFVALPESAAAGAPRDVVVLADCSSSTNGGVSVAIRNAVAEFVKLLPSLPKGSKFDIGAFGTECRFLFNERLPADNESLQLAKEFVNSIEPNMGGTQLRKALVAVAHPGLLQCDKKHQLTFPASWDLSYKCSSCCGSEGRPAQCAKCGILKCHHCLGGAANVKLFQHTDPQTRNVSVILLTDAAVANYEALSEFIKGTLTSISVFPIGIGHGVSRATVRSLASASGGYPEFCSAEEDIAPVFFRQVSRVFRSVREASVTWVVDGLVREMVDASGKIPFPLIEGSSVTAFAMAKKHGFNGGSATLAGEGFAATAGSGGSLAIVKGKTIHRLCAKAAIRRMEEEKQPNKEAIVAMAKAYKLASKLTSFVATVDRAEATTGTMEVARVPVARPKKAAPASTSASASGTRSVPFTGETPKVAREFVKTSSGGSVSLGGRFCNSYHCTIGADFKTASAIVGGEECRLQMWDTSGQERFHSLGRMYYRGVSAVFLVFDVTRKDTIDGAKRWLQELLANLEGANCTVVLVGNKIDLADSRQVTREQGEKVAAEMHVPYFEISCKTAEGIAEMVAAVVRDVYSWSHGKLAKIVTLGDAGCGKTSLTDRLSASTVSLPDVAPPKFSDGDAAKGAALSPPTAATTPSAGFWSGWC